MLTNRFRDLGERVATGHGRVVIAAMIGVTYLAINTATAESLYAWHHAPRLFAWVGLTAVAMAALAAGYAAGQEDPAVRPLALALLVLAIYMAGVAAGYDPDRDHARYASVATWWAAPFVVALWARAASRITSVRGLAQTPLVEDAFASAARLAPVAGRQQGLRVAARRVRRGAIWGVALAFAIAGTLPDRLFSLNENADVDWRGQTYTILRPYGLFAVWAIVVVVATWLMLERAWHGRRRGLPPSVETYGRYTLYASRFLVAAVVFLFMYPAGLWPESQVDLLLSACVVAFVLLLVEAGGLRRPRRVPSAHRRLGWGAAALVGLLLVIATVGMPPTHAAAFAVLAGVGLPLIGRFERALYGWAEGPRPTLAERIAREGLPPTDEERSAMRGLLVTGQWSARLNPGRQKELRRRLRAAVRALETTAEDARAGKRGDQRQEVREPLRALLLELRAGSTPPRPAPPDLVNALESFPVLEGDRDARLVQFPRLLYDSACHLRQQEASEPPGLHPSALRMVEIECARRIDDDDPERLFLVDAYSRWRQRRATWAELESRPRDLPYQSTDPTLREIKPDTVRRLGRERLAAGCAEILNAWHEHLKPPPRSPGHPGV